MPQGTLSHEVQIDAPLSIDFTAEELVVLANALDVDLPIDEPESLQGDVAVRAALVDLARRSLVARRFLSTDGFAFSVVRAVAKLLEIVAEPGLVVRFGRNDAVPTFANADAYEEAEDAPVVLARPDVAVELAPLTHTGHRFIPFATTDVLMRIAELTRLDERCVPADAKAFTLPVDALAATLRLAAAGRMAAAVGSLLAENIDERSAQAFVRALMNQPVGHSVDMLHRPTDTVIAGGSMQWIDAGAAGLWLLPALDEDERAGDTKLVTITPATREDILDELTTYLPS